MPGHRPYWQSAGNVNAVRQNANVEPDINTATIIETPLPTGAIPFSHSSPYCVSPQQVFAASAAFTAFLASNLTQKELLTLVNILTMITTNLSAIVTQQELCEGIVIQPSE